jgi:hypothetical protein
LMLHGKCPPPHYNNIPVPRHTMLTSSVFVTGRVHPIRPIIPRKDARTRKAPGQGARARGAGARIGVPHGAEPFVGEGYPGV